MSDPHGGWQAEALADFCRGLGFDGHPLGGPGDVANFEIGNNDYLLGVERCGEDLIMAMFKEVPFRDLDGSARKLLGQCRHDHYHPFHVQAGLSGSSTLALATRIDRSVAGRMVNAYELLRKLFRDAGL